jgi:hypothetical protein
MESKDLNNIDNKKFLNEVIILLLEDLKKQGTLNFDEKLTKQMDNQILTGYIFQEILTFIYQKYYIYFDKRKFPDIRFEVNKNLAINYYIN